MEGLKGQQETQQLLEKYPISNLNHALLSFVAAARNALGPNMLKVLPHKAGGLVRGFHP